MTEFTLSTVLLTLALRLRAETDSPASGFVSAHKGIGKVLANGHHEAGIPLGLNSPWSCNWPDSPLAATLQA